MKLDGSIEVTGNNVTFSFYGVGSGITGFLCKLDRQRLPDCKLNMQYQYHFITLNTCLIACFTDCKWSSYIYVLLNIEWIGYLYII